MAVRRENTHTVMALPTKKLSVPYREIDSLQGCALGFHMNVIEGDHGGVDSGGGCSSPWVAIVHWKGRGMTIHAMDLLAAFVETFDKKEAEEIRAAAWPLGANITAEGGP